MKLSDIKIGDDLSFEYKGRKVKGNVLSNYGLLIIKLYTFYKGKQKDWEEGETKSFIFSECKKLKILK